MFLLELYILPTLLSGLNDDCRNYTVCTPSTCFGLKKVKVKEIVFEAALKLSKNLVEQSSMSVNSYHVVNVFNTYERGMDFRNQYLTIKRGGEDE